MLHNVKEVLKQVFCYPKLVFEDFDYDHYWLKKRGSTLGVTSKWQKQRADWINSKIEDGSSVLDVGCGDGGVLLYLSSMKDINPVGADISDICIDFLTKKNIRVVKFDVNDFSSIQELPEVDHVLILEVLEHMQNPEKFLQLIMSKAKKSIFFSFPNSGYFSYRLRFLLGRFPLQWSLHPGEHLRFWTYCDLKWWLKELGVADESTIFVYEGIPILNRLWKSLFGAGFVVEIKTKI